jgi:hypothetical protein
VSDLGEYHGQLVSRLRALLGPDLVGVYAGGSVALGGYLEGRSDLDVAVVCRSPLTDRQKEEIADTLRHESLPCPARGLELVVYTESTLRSGTGEPAYELNLNTGRGMPFVLSFAPEGEVHWYAIDRAVVREHGVPLAGPWPADLFAPISRHVLLGRVSESVRWYAEHTWAGADNAVLNACRALRYACEGTWSSKSDAGEWALERTDDRALVADALAARIDGRPLDSERVQRFLGFVLDALQAARDEPSHS